MKPYTFGLLAVVALLGSSSVIPISMSISSPPNYRNLLALRYGELQKHNLLRTLHQSPRLSLNPQLNN
jgi:hypothetical protein